MARQGRTKVIYKGTFISKQSLSTKANCLKALNWTDNSRKSDARKWVNVSRLVFARVLSLFNSHKHVQI